MKIVQEHLAPKPLVTAERLRFHKSNQLESASSFVSEVKKLSEYCNLKDRFNDTLRDRFVGELLNVAVQRKLLTEEGLTFKHAIEIV